MPVNTPTTRRAFLEKGLTLVGLGFTAPSFLAKTALAINLPVETSKKNDGRVLVVVQLAGGNDGLNTLVPFTDDVYYNARPRLAIPPDDVLRLTDELGFHPAGAGFKRLYDAGQLSIVQSVGYPNPNRSHFKSTDAWATACPDGRNKSGWIGRYFDNACAGAAPCSPSSAIALTPELPLALQGDAFRAIAFEHPQALQWEGSKQPRLADAFNAFHRPDADAAHAELHYLQRVAMDAVIEAGAIRRAARGKSVVPYPSGAFARSLRMVGRMIAAELPTRVYYVSLGGFDTHARQAGRHARLLTELSNSLEAFVADLVDQGNLERVAVMTFSEFGRRVAENASGGTDHGEAAPMFMLGGSLEPGLHGKTPDLAQLHRGDVAFRVDFRSVYAAVLGDWFGVDAQALLGKHPRKLALFRER